MKHFLSPVSIRLFFPMLLFFQVSVILLDLSVVHASQAVNALPAYSHDYDVSRDPMADGRDALKLATATDRKVLIEVGGDWCRWCHVLDRFIKDHPDVQSRLYKTFVVLKVNVSDENDNAEFMKTFPPTKGYPHMYITDSEGTILHSQDTADFREDKKYSERRFMIFFDRWQNHDE